MPCLSLQCPVVPFLCLLLSAVFLNSLKSSIKRSLNEIRKKYRKKGRETETISYFYTLVYPYLRLGKRKVFN